MTRSLSKFPVMDDVGVTNGREQERSSSSPTSAAYDKCFDQWAPDSLVGKCHGLIPSTSIPELQHVFVKSADQCRSMCCVLGEKCSTWQFLTADNICNLGGEVLFEGNIKP